MFMVFVDQLEGLEVACLHWFVCDPLLTYVWVFVDSFDSFLDDAFRKNLESALRFGNPLLVQVQYTVCT